MRTSLWSGEHDGDVPRSVDREIDEGPSCGRRVRARAATIRLQQRERAHRTRLEDRRQALLQHSHDVAVRARLDHRLAGDRQIDSRHRRSGRAHDDLTASVALCDPAGIAHLLPDGAIGGVAMIGIDPVVPKSIDGNGCERARAARDVGKRNVKDAGRLEVEGRKSSLDLRALRRRCRIEMRITERRRNVEATDRARAGNVRRVGVERQAGALPSRMHARVEIGDLLLGGRDEIVILNGVVELDNGCVLAARCCG